MMPRKMQKLKRRNKNANGSFRKGEVVFGLVLFCKGGH